MSDLDTKDGKRFDAASEYLYEKKIAEHVYRRRIASENCRAAEDANEKYRAQLKEANAKIAELENSICMAMKENSALEEAKRQARAEAFEEAAGLIRRFPRCTRDTMVANYEHLAMKARATQTTPESAEEMREGES